MKKNDIIRRIENHLEESKKLSVYRIMIGSPGGFSLTGIPETIREVKELIRYIWKLRRQDDLDNKKKCLDLVKEWFEITHNDKPKIIDIKIAIELLCDGIINIKKFEASGKIDDVLNNLEYLPEYTDFDSNTQNLRQNINRE